MAGSRVLFSCICSIRNNSTSILPAFGPSRPVEPSENRRMQKSPPVGDQAEHGQRNTSGIWPGAWKVAALRADDPPARFDHHCEPSMEFLVHHTLRCVPRGRRASVVKWPKSPQILHKPRKHKRTVNCFHAHIILEFNSRASLCLFAPPTPCSPPLSLQACLTSKRVARKADTASSTRAAHARSAKVRGRSARVRWHRPLVNIDADCRDFSRSVPTFRSQAMCW